MRTPVGLFFVSFGLSSCFNMPVVSTGKVSVIDNAPRLAASVSSTSGKAVSSFDPAAKVATTIPAPTGALAGSSITFPAGALAIATELVVEESVPLAQTSVASSLSLREDMTITPVGSGLIIRPTTDVDLTKPLTIAMPLNPNATGLAEWMKKSFSLQTRYYTVFYKYFVNGELKAGAIASSTLRFGDDGTVLFEGYFGAYWLAELSIPLEEKVEIKTEEPIVNKDHVSVISSAGIVTEKDIVAKASIPEVQWTAVNLTFDEAKRAVTLAATISGGRTLSACTADLFEKSEGSGFNVDTGANLSAQYIITKKEAHNLFGRFRCQDDQARLAVSPWSTVVAIPAVVVPVPEPVVVEPAKPVVIANPYCSTVQADIKMLVGSSTTMYPFKSLTALGNCAYSVEIDTLGPFRFNFQTADGKFCQSSTAAMGEQTILCSSSSALALVMEPPVVGGIGSTGVAAPSGMSLPQGNYVIKLDFTASSTQPKLSIDLQPCALGDIYLSRSTSYNFGSPVAADKMQHLGGCQYTSTIPVSGYESSSYVRIQNLEGSFGCGDGSSIQNGNSKDISCGAGRTSYMQYSAGGNIVSYRYLLNLGQNLDINGVPTSSSYLWFQASDICSQNLYILGPTPAGNNRVLGVNNLKKDYSCSHFYSWMADATAFTPFYIGVGENGQKCGVPTGTASNTYVNLDCSASAEPIDLQSYIVNGKGFRIHLGSNSTTGLPYDLSVTPLDLMCGESWYLANTSAGGFQPRPQRQFAEVKECIFQYDWTPTTGEKSFMVLNGNDPRMRCGHFAGLPNPTLNGPAVNAGCLSDNNLAQNYPLLPNGVVDGGSYKVTLDLRLGATENPKISIANNSAPSCPSELYMLGYPFPSYPDPSNKMTKLNGCNYVFNYKVASGVNFAYFKVMDAAQNLQCGQDQYLAYPNAELNGRTVPMVCANGTSLPYSININYGANVQFQMHYDAGGASTMSVNYLNDNCGVTPILDGAAASNQNGSLSFTPTNECIHELVWTPMNGVNNFQIKFTSGGVTSYCGLDVGASQPTLGGGQSQAICNVFNPASIAPFTVGGMTAGQKYLIRLNRQNYFGSLSKLTVTPVNSYFQDPQGAMISGYPISSVINNTTHPGSREGSMTWSDPITGYKYLFGGYGLDDAGNTNNLADLWRFDGNTWTLLPASDFGVSTGYVSSPGSFAAANRPSARRNAVAFFDPSDSGKLWLFAGLGTDSVSNTGYLNDLWVYDLALNQWALMSGDVYTDLPGFYASAGIASHANYPGGRELAIGWIDAAGKLYIFGGHGICDNACSGYASGKLNDLWVFDPSTSQSTNTWTYLGGSGAVDQSGYGSIPSSREGAFAWRDGDNLWLFGGLGYDINFSVGFLNDLWRYNIPGNSWTKKGGSTLINSIGAVGMKGVGSTSTYPGARAFGGSWKGTDGKFWFFGGEGFAGPGNTTPGSYNDVWRFDPSLNEWTWVTGAYQYYSVGYEPAPNQVGYWGSLGSFNPGFMPASRRSAAVWSDANNNVMIFGGFGYLNNYTYGPLQDVWYLDF